MPATWTNAVRDLNEAEVTALVEDYLFKRTDDAESMRILETVRSLDQESTQLFRRIALERGNPTEEQRELALLAMDYADEKGVPMLDLTPEDGREIPARFTGLPIERIRPEITANASQLEVPAGVAVSRQAECAWYEAACSYTSAWNTGAGRFGM